MAFLLQVTVFLIGAYAKYNWPYVWVSVGSSYTGLELELGSISTVAVLQEVQAVGTYKPLSS
jgi:hypothetical protein